jgi:hypothetical protein
MLRDRKLTISEDQHWEQALLHGKFTSPLEMHGNFAGQVFGQRVGF